MSDMKSGPERPSSFRRAFAKRPMPSAKGEVVLRLKGDILEKVVALAKIESGTLLMTDSELRQAASGNDAVDDGDGNGGWYLEDTETSEMVMNGSLRPSHVYNIVFDNVNSKPHPSSGVYNTLVAYRDDDKMVLHDTARGNHPERPSRVVRILEALSEAGIISRREADGGGDTGSVKRMATESDLSLIHNDRILTNLSTLNPSEATYVNEHTKEAVLAAVGTVLFAMDAVAKDKSYHNAFCVVRPPGHHCSDGHSDGFCLVNNVAIATRYAQRVLGLGNIAIVDFDVHHGDGTQAIFVDDPTVLYTSLHRHDGGKFFPFTGNLSETGANGTNVNVPFDCRKSSTDGVHPNKLSDFEFVKVVQDLWVPLLTAFAPDAILLSAGYDAAHGDPLGHMDATPKAFAFTAALLQHTFPESKIVAVLEGGYNLECLREGVLATVRGLRGEFSMEELNSIVVPNIMKSEESKGLLQHKEQRWAELKQDVMAAHASSHLFQKMFSAEELSSAKILSEERKEKVVEEHKEND
eukprot:PhM_4_TR15246/c0_g1_i2/m.59396/K11407/HDAC6; histone deacetylase 6